MIKKTKKLNKYWKDEYVEVGRCLLDSQSNNHITLKFIGSDINCIDYDTPLDFAPVTKEDILYELNHLIKDRFALMNSDGTYRVQRPEKLKKFLKHYTPTRELIHRLLI